jgi:hypothetical protein
MSNGKKHDSGASEGARRATEDAPESSAKAGAGRWSAKHAAEVGTGTVEKYVGNRGSGRSGSMRLLRTRKGD